MHILLEEIEQKVVKICEYVDKHIFTVEYCTTQSLTKGLMSTMGKDFDKIGARTFTHIEDLNYVNYLIK